MEPPTREQRMAVVRTSWQRTLSEIPTLLGRLAYLSSLRTGEAGRYEHYGIAQRLGADDTHEFLRDCHVEVFQECLALDLRGRKRDVENYLFENGDMFWGDGGEGPKALASFISLEPWAAWLPESSRDVERNLFREDMKFLLELLRREAGVAPRDPDL